MIMLKLLDSILLGCMLTGIIIWLCEGIGTLFVWIIEKIMNLMER